MLRTITGLVFGTMIATTVSAFEDLGDYPDTPEIAGPVHKITYNGAELPAWVFDRTGKPIASGYTTKYYWENGCRVKTTQYDTDNQVEKLDKTQECTSEGLPKIAHMHRSTPPVEFKYIINNMGNGGILISKSVRNSLSTFELDAKGRLIKEQWGMSGEPPFKLSSTERWEYEEYGSGALKKKRHYKETGFESEHLNEEWDYADKPGPAVLKSRKWYDRRGSYNGGRRYDQYKFDKYGNWLTRRVCWRVNEEERCHEETREITYYR